MIEKIKKIFKVKHKFKRFIYACRHCLETDLLNPLGRYDFVDTDTLVGNYIENMHVARFYAESKGGKYLNFLQPYCGEGRKQFSKFEMSSIDHVAKRKTADGSNEFELIRQFYDKLWEKIGPQDNTFDLRGVFYDYDDEFYFDQAHCSDLGYDIIAKAIADEIRCCEVGPGQHEQAGIERAHS